MSGYITSPTIQDNVNEQSNIIDSLGENTKLTDLNVIAYAYRTNGTLKWVDILDAQGNITRCNCVTVEDIIYIDWHGQYVWTDINCKTLQVGGELFEEVVDDIEYLKNKEMIVDLTSTSPASLGDDSDPAKIGIEIPTETVPITVGLAENAEGILVESETNNEIDVVGSLTNEVAPFKHLKKSSLVFNPSTKTLFNGEEYFLTQSQSARYLTSDAQGNPFSSLVSLQTDDKYYNGSITAAGLNDYAIVLDQVNNTAQRYVFTGSQWAFQYNINTTTFSSDQWNAINSMATENKIKRSLLSICQIQQGAAANSIELYDINGTVYTEPPFDNIQLVCYSQINITGGALKWGSFNVLDANGNNVTSINKGTVFCLNYSTLNGVRLYKEHFLNGDRVLVSNNNNASGISESNILLSDLNNVVTFFTYIVDSNQKLADWANNVPGNDYTSVLIIGNRTLPDSARKLHSGGYCYYYIDCNETNTVFIQGINNAKITYDYTPSTDTNEKETIVIIGKPFIKGNCSRNRADASTPSTLIKDLYIYCNSHQGSMTTYNVKLIAVYNCTIYNSKIEVFTKRFMGIALFNSSALYCNISSYGNRNACGVIFDTPTSLPTQNYYFLNVYNCTIYTGSYAAGCVGIAITLGNLAKVSIRNNIIETFTQADSDFLYNYYGHCSCIVSSNTDFTTIEDNYCIISGPSSTQRGLYKVSGAKNNKVTGNGTLYDTCCANKGAYNSAYAAANTPNGGWNS